MIHYFWFGNKPLPELAEKCIESWKKYLPDYEIKQWNEKNFDVHRVAYTDEAYRLKQYAHVSDYARFWILYNYGGICFDTDVEVIRPIDDIIAKGPFMGFECPEGTALDNPHGDVNPGLGIAAYPQHPFLRKVLDYYDSIHFAGWNGRNTGNVTRLTTQLLDYENKEVMEDGVVCVNGMRIYPEEYFCPVNYYSSEKTITPRTRTIHHYLASWTSPGGHLKSICERLRFIMARMRILPGFLSVALMLLTPLSCKRHEYASELERTQYRFINEIGGDVGADQWWETAVKINLTLSSTSPVRIWLTSEPNAGVIYDYKECDGSGEVSLTAPQGYENPLYLSVYDHTSVTVKSVLLTGKPEESVTMVIEKNKAPRPRTKAGTEPVHPSSLCGNSINGNPRYYEFNNEEMADFHAIMDIVRTDVDAKEAGLNTDYEMTANGPFFIVWVTGYAASQLPHILGVFYHSPDSYEDIVYQDICETHKWDYIDGLAKVQYQFDTDITVDGHTFLANEWYDANFDIYDYYGSAFSDNMDRIGDNAYNTQIVYNVYGSHISAYQGIAFEVNVPKGKRIGFYLRADEVSAPEQWKRLTIKGIRPQTSSESQFKGTSFSVEDWNIEGDHRSFIYQSSAMTWIGMEDMVSGGDRDCNDVVFGLIGDLSIEPPVLPIVGTVSFPWVLAFDDIYRGSDFDFNDAVIKLVPNPMTETCQVTVMAAGTQARAFLHYTGPDGDYNLGEIHQLLTGNMDPVCINTESAIASVPSVKVASVPWPCEYTMANDARRFWVEIQRGTCENCYDALMLPDTPGERMPAAILIASQWRWPMEGVPIYDAYVDFSQWAKDPTRTRYWDWFKQPSPETYVSY